MARALAEVGQYEEAAAVARSITDRTSGRRRWQRWPARWPGPADTSRPPPSPLHHRPCRQAQALAAVAEEPARADQHEQAADVARSITNPHQQAQALAAVAEGLARSGQRDQAFAVAARAEAAARSIIDWDRQAQALVLVAGALAARGDRHERLTWLRRRVPSEDGRQCSGWCCRWSHRRWRVLSTCNFSPSTADEGHDAISQ